MHNDRKQCWLMEGCPSRTGVCYSCVPDGDDCPIWRWFKKQIIVRCKDCKHKGQTIHQKDGTNIIVCWNQGYGIHHPIDWYCADGELKEGVNE